MPKIAFWRVDVGVNAESQVPVLFQHHLVCATIAAIDWEHRVPDKMWGASLISSPDAYSAERITFAAVRDEELVLAKKGQLSHLPLDDDQGVAALARAVFFEKNIVGMMISPRGPAIASLAKFLSTIRPDLHDKVVLLPLFREDAVKQLERIHVFRRLRMKVTPSALRQAPLGPMRDAVEKVQAIGLGNGSDGHIVVEISGTKKSPIANLVDTVKSWVQKTSDDSAEVNVDGYDSGDEKISIRFSDYRHEYLVDFDDKPSTRTIFDTIIRLHAEHQQDLLMAAGVVLEVES